MKDSRNLGIFIYLFLSALIAVYLISVYHFGGSAALDKIFKVGPASYKTITIFVICACWILAGVIVVLKWRPVLAKGRTLFIILFVLLAFFHLNILREPHLAKRGDFGVYWKAVRCVEAGKPFPNGYIYPPLLTSLLQPFFPLGAREASNYFKITNYAAVLVLYFLLYVTLQRYGFSRRLAAAAPFVLLVFNVPLCRAIAYQQVTIHVVNLILLSLLLYERSNPLSALALCGAVNLKVTPVVLILPFLVNREWRWFFYFFMGQALIVGYTCWMSGPQYWSNFLYESSKIVAFAYRNNSIDSFIFNLFRFAGLGRPSSYMVSAALKIYIVFLTVRLWLLASRREVFYSGERRAGIVYNGYVALMLLMVIISPRVWAHYFVILSLPFLVFFKCIRGERELVLYMFCYSLIYLVPVFDLFPISYYRLAGLVICYGLFWVFCQPVSRAGVHWQARVEGAFAGAAASWGRP
jgi:hypothetical protein